MPSPLQISYVYIHIHCIATHSEPHLLIIHCIATGRHIQSHTYSSFTAVGYQLAYEIITEMCLHCTNVSRTTKVTEQSRHSSSSRMRVINHNWSAMKQRPHPQSVAEISRHSVLSGTGFNNVRHRLGPPQGHRSVSNSRHFLLQAPQCPGSNVL